MTSLVTECSSIHRIMLGYANTVQFLFVNYNYNILLFHLNTYMYMRH